MRLISFVFTLMLPGAALAQDRAATLADIRQEMSVLYVEIQSLKRELSTTGSPNVNLPSGILDRVIAIETELARLTGQTEQLQFKVDQVVRDGTNQIGDLEFRLCELEPNCDISQLSETTTLGGDTGQQVAAPATPAPATPTAPEAAVGEDVDFEQAKALLDGGDAAGAAAAFMRYIETYPGGVYTADAHFFRGEAEAAQGSWSKAARAYLESFSGTPNGPRAPDALLKLGVSLGELGQRDEACLTLQEVGIRFPGGTPATEAQTKRVELSCL